jgi:hypothetical protein
MLLPSSGLNCLHSELRLGCKDDAHKTQGSGQQRRPIAASGKNWQKSKLLGGTVGFSSKVGSRILQNDGLSQGHNSDFRGKNVNSEKEKKERNKSAFFRVPAAGTWKVSKQHFFRLSE